MMSARTECELLELNNQKINYILEICCLTPSMVSGFASVGKSRQCVHDQILSTFTQCFLSASLISSVISSSLIAVKVLSVFLIGCLLV